jgi:chromosome segregation ATPase
MFSSRFLPYQLGLAALYYRFDTWCSYKQQALDSKLTARDDHRLVIDLRIKLKESLDELATQQFQAVEAASELERCRTSRAELQLALEEEKQKIVRMRLANDEMLAELRQCKARAEKQADYIQKKVRALFAYDVLFSFWK